MIIGDLNFVRVASAPPKTDSPLMVHANAVPTRSTPGESLQPVPRGYPEVLQCLCGVNNQQLSVRPSLHVHWEAPRAHPQKHLFRFGIAESSNHLLILTSSVIIVKRYYKHVRPNKRRKLTGRRALQISVLPSGHEIKRFQLPGHLGRKLSREPLGGGMWAALDSSPSSTDRISTALSCVRLASSRTRSRWRADRGSTSGFDPSPTSCGHERG
jgi:hypothetical protein